MRNTYVLMSVCLGYKPPTPSNAEMQRKREIKHELVFVWKLILSTTSTV